MIRRKGNVYKLDTPATTLLLGAGESSSITAGGLPSAAVITNF